MSDSGGKKLWLLPSLSKRKRPLEKDEFGAAVDKHKAKAFKGILMFVQLPKQT
jgi:hypothetical protein